MDERPAALSSVEAGLEAALVLATQRGEAGACAELLRLHHRFLHRLCLALTHDEARAGALECEIARRLWRNRSQLQVGQPLLPHFTRLARALAVADARRHGGEGPPPRRPNGQPWESGALGAHDVGYEQRLLGALAALPMEDRLLLALRSFERLPYADVAAITGLNVASTLHRVAGVRERLEAAMLAKDSAA